MQENESVVVVRFELKIASLWITVTLVTEFSVRTSQPLKSLIILGDRIFSLYLTFVISFY